MTERTLEKAIKIKYTIDDLRRRKSDLVEKQALCWGNTNEVMAREFKVVIADKPALRDIKITAEAAKKALDYEIQKTDEMLDKCLSDLAELA